MSSDLKDHNTNEILAQLSTGALKRDTVKLMQLILQRMADVTKLPNGDIEMIFNIPATRFRYVVDHEEVKFTSTDHIVGWATVTAFNQFARGLLNSQVDMDKIGAYLDAMESEEQKKRVEENMRLNRKLEMLE